MIYGKFYRYVGRCQAKKTCVILIHCKARQKIDSNDSKNAVEHYKQQLMRSCAKQGYGWQSIQVDHIKLNTHVVHRQSCLKRVNRRH